MAVIGFWQNLWLKRSGLKSFKGIDETRDTVAGG